MPTHGDRGMVTSNERPTTAFCSSVGRRGATRAGAVRARAAAARRGTGAGRCSAAAR